MNKKFISGLITLVIGLALGGTGFYLSAQYLGTGLLYANSFFSKYYFAIGPALFIIGVILTLVGYSKACKNFVMPEKKPRVKKEKAPKAAPAAPAPVAVPVAAPAPQPAKTEETTDIAKNGPLDATQISYTFCGKCGKRNKTGAKFCSGCGEKF